MTSRLQRVLLCATPEEYWEWQGRPGSGPPLIVTNHDRRFCLDSDIDWCRGERAAGRCCLSDGEFAYVEQQMTSQEDQMTTTLPKTIAQRAAAKRAAEAMAARARDQLPVTLRRPITEPVPEAPRQPPRRKWEVWTAPARESRRAPAIPSLSIYSNGTIRLSLSAVAMLGDPAPTFLQLLWDPETETLGLRPVASRLRGAARLNVNMAQANGLLTSLTFFEAHQLLPDKLGRRPVSLEDGVLICCLRDPVIGRKAVTHA